MYTVILVCFMLFCEGISMNFSNSADTNRTGKFIGWWGVGVVRFENSVCAAANGLTGICYTRRQCTSIGGYPSGKCARNIGVCCVVQVYCGATSSNNNTYFSNPTFPNTFTGASSCRLTIQRCNPDICQLRIDLLSFTLAQPDAAGVCTSDAMVISGAGTNVGRICGENNGQHIYLDFDGAKDVVINIYTSPTVSVGRQWNIRIAQIGCDSPSRAPSGCLMYYTGTSGSVRSFNYGQSLASGGTRQLANMNYGVCVRAAPGYCSIEWSATGFLVTDIAGSPLQTGTACSTDYVVIPDGSVTVGGLPLYDRFCGSSWATVTSQTRPFVLYAVTNGDEVTDVANTGFSLSYSQQQCQIFL